MVLVDIIDIGKEMKSYIIFNFITIFVSKKKRGKIIINNNFPF